MSSMPNDRTGRDQITYGDQITVGDIGDEAVVALGRNAKAIKAVTYIEHYHAAAAPYAARVHQLPAPPASFTGRKRELAELLAQMTDAGSGVALCGLYGMGGVGKTALALVLANRLQAAYPDVQIYLDLRGVSDNLLSPQDALQTVIRSFYSLETKLPTETIPLRALYLSSLHDKRALLLLDNAKDAAQIELLIPPTGCALIVTSRSYIALPGLYAHPLEPLSPSEAGDLLRRLTPNVGSHTEELVNLCGCLPIALELAGSVLAEPAAPHPAEYLARLENAQTRFPPVDAALHTSYDLLTDELQLRWRQLAVFPDTFDRSAAAALWGYEPDDTAPESAHELLRALVKASMVQAIGSGAAPLQTVGERRYRLHELARGFARILLSRNEQGNADARHAEYYLTVVRTANQLFQSGGESMKQALLLVDMDWANIQAGQAWSAACATQDTAAARICSDYPYAGLDCLTLRLHPNELIRWVEAGLAAAQSLSDRVVEGTLIVSLGEFYAVLGETHRAIEYEEQSLGIAREIGDRRIEGRALGSLAVAHMARGEAQKAIDLLLQRLPIAREIGDRRAEGRVLGNLGLAHAMLGLPRKAKAYYEHYLSIAREIGDRRGEGSALGNLGQAHAALGQARKAIGFYEQGLAIRHDIGDRLGESTVLGNLGFAYYRQGDLRKAVWYYEQALALARELGIPGLEARHLWNQSVALYKLGDQGGAIAQAQAALKIREAIGDPNTEKVRQQLAAWQGRKRWQWWKR